MNKELVKIRSVNMNRDMEVAIYGHYGLVLLMFPSTLDSCVQNEHEGLIDSIAPYINRGKVKVYSVSSVNFNSWLNTEIPNEEKSRIHYDYDKFIAEEVIRLIYEDTGGAIPIMTCGAAIGAYHAANTYFKRPDLFLGTIAMSGTFNIQHFSGSYFDETCYFNSPVHYIPNLTDPYWLTFLQSHHHVYLFSGSGINEFPENSRHMSDILNSKGINHNIDVWGDEWGHDWETWKAMLPQIIRTKL
jgi:esterase/lipase superfamily enzyme